jgi:hypothetical protein
MATSIHRSRSTLLQGQGTMSTPLHFLTRASSEGVVNTKIDIFSVSLNAAKRSSRCSTLSSGVGASSKSRTPSSEPGSLKDDTGRNP